MISNIFLSPPFDMAGVIFMLIGTALGIVSLLAAILLEAGLLWVIGWGPIAKSLFASILINVVTIVLGYYVLEPCINLIDNIYRDRAPRSVEEITLWILLWAMTMIVEGVLLFLIDHSSLPKTCVASFIINVASYIMLFIVYCGFKSLQP